MRPTPVAERRGLSARTRHIALVLLATCPLVASACESAPPPPPAPPPLTEDSLTAPSAPDEGELVFDREFLFLSMGADSLILVPWLFRATVTSDAVHQEHSAWLSQGGDWEVLSQEATDAPPSRTPWRILPGDRVRLIMGREDRVQSLLLRDPPRELETALDELMTEWARPGAEAVRLYRARTLFPAADVEGIVVEISRRWEVTENGGPGDWAFLHSGPDLQLFMEQDPYVGGPEDEASYHGWTRVALRDLQWQDLELRWEETTAFENARRDVPTRWSLDSRDGGVTGSLDLVSSQLIVGQGDGPILPLLGLFEVSGEVAVEGEEFAVRGMIRHVQR